MSGQTRGAPGGQGPQPRIWAPGRGQPRWLPLPPGREHPSPWAALPGRPPRAQPLLRSTSSRRARMCTARGAAARPGTRPAWPSRPASDSVTSPSPFHSPRLNRGKVEKSKGSTQVRGEEGVLGLWSFCPKFLGPPPRPAPIPVTSPQPLPPPPPVGLRLLRPCSVLGGWSLTTWGAGRPHSPPGFCPRR